MQQVDSFVRKLEAVLGLRAQVQPWSCPDDPTIRAFVWLLDVPAGRLTAVEDAAWHLAGEAFHGPVPFLLSAVSPGNTARYFPGSHGLLGPQGLPWHFPG